MQFRTKALTTPLAVALDACRLRNTAAVCAALVAIGVSLSDRLSEIASAQSVRERPLQRKQVQRSVSIQWERVPLRDVVARVAKLFDETVFIDRRVDPDLRVTLELEATSIDDVLRSIVEAQSLGMSRLGSARYLGPRNAAEHLRTVSVARGEEIARLNRAERADLERKQRLTWPRLSEPRELVVLLAQQRGWRISRAERIPHDLWAAGALPELSAAEQLTLLLAGFDLSFKTQARDRSLEIVPLQPVTVRREYRLPSRSSDNALLRQELQAAPAARMEDRKLVVDARIEQHERLAEIIAGHAVPPRSRRPATESARQYTLRVQDQPVGAILRQLAERMNWTMEFDEASIRAAGLSLDRRVSFSVENGNQDELLQAVLAPAGLDYRRQGERLVIAPRSGRQ